MSEKEESMVSVAAYTIDIDESRSVSVWRHDGDFGFRFSNGDSKQYLRLSPEAWKAVRQLVAQISLDERAA